MVIVTPAPEGIKEQEAKRWHRRQELQAVLTSLVTIRQQLSRDDVDLAVSDLISDASDLVQKAMEILSPRPRARLAPKKPFPWDK